MTKSLCILVRRAPYGMIHAAEAFRYLIGTQAFGFKVITILVDDGVYMAKDNQDADAYGWTSLSNPLSSVLEVDKSQNIKVYVHEESLITSGIRKEDLIESIELVNDIRLAEILGASDVVMLF